MTALMKVKLLTLLSLIFAFTVDSARVTNPKKVPKNAVLLSRISALTLRAGQHTTSRRVAPVPQLQCVGPSKVCNLYSVDVMRCTNEGADYDPNNIQWSCRASLPEEFKLGSTDVSCEGYESSEDPYVLSGSCGVEYRLLLTEKGEEKYGSQNKFDFSSSRGDGDTGEKIASYVFMTAFCIVLFIILRALYNSWRNDTPARRLRGGGPGGYGGGGGGGPGGGGGNDDPPPPYDPRTPPRPKKASWGSSSRSSFTAPTGGYQDQGWRPGFWTGTAAGAAAGYFAGRGTRTQPAPPERRPTTGSWFGGGGTTAGPSSSRNTSSSSSSSPSFSSSRHESTGFGGTSRR